MELQSRSLDKRKELYATVLGQCYSPCGQYLACSNHLGKIVIFNVAQALNVDVVTEALHPYFSFYVPCEDQILCLAQKEGYLSGGSSNGTVYVWNWSDLIKKDSKQVLHFCVPRSSFWDLGSVEINYIVFIGESANELRMYAAGGDNMIHIWNMSTKKYMGRLEGHTDSVLCLDAKARTNVIYSGSEDGLVKVWDTRIGNSATYEIVPSMDKKCSRNYLGKWIKCLTAIAERDWIVCGGGPLPALWQVGYPDSMCTFDSPEFVPNDVLSNDGTIISGGNDSLIRHWSLNGKEEACVPCTPTNVFSIAINCSDHFPKVLSIAGNCNKVDICTNFNYKSFSFHIF